MFGGTLYPFSLFSSAALFPTILRFGPLCFPVINHPAHGLVTLDVELRGDGIGRHPLICVRLNDRGIPFSFELLR
ncbi:hypothetical protein D3C76_1454740 [compost metagenome]